MDMRIPPLKSKILLESNPLKFRILAWRLAVRFSMRPERSSRKRTEEPPPFCGPFGEARTPSKKVGEHIIYMYIYIYRERERERDLYDP